MDCGWWCSPLPQSLENQISTALMMDYELLAEKGRTAVSSSSTNTPPR